MVVMAYFAKLNNGTVEKVISVSNSDLGEPAYSFPQTEQTGLEFISNILGLDGEWLQTSYNASFRRNYAGIGFSYDHGRDAFIPPKPFPSWLLDDETCRWIAPVAYPDDGKAYTWDETTTNWKEITNDPV